MKSQSLAAGFVEDKVQPPSLAAGFVEDEPPPPRAEPGSVDPDPPTPMQSTGIAGSLIGLPFDPDTQGVTGMHGETGDPMARDITSGVALNPAMKLLGAGVRMGANRLLSSAGGRAAQAVEAGAGVTAPTAAEIEAARAQADAVIAQGFEPLAAKVPEIAEILRKPAELEARAALAANAAKGAETLKPDLVPSAHSVAAAAGLGGFGHAKFAPLAIVADLLRQNAAPIAGRLAPAARAVAGAEASPLSTPGAAAMMNIFGRRMTTDR